MSQPLERALVRDLGRIVGEGAVITAAERLITYESDGLTAYRAAPSAVVLPADTDQARRVVAALHGTGIPVVPRGAGTGLSGGALATAGGVVVGTARMNRILDLDVEDRRARVQAGMINARLSAAARPHGLYYAPDPSSQSACTLGGNVAENSGGPHCLKYGVTSRYVTGLTLVLPDGAMVELGGRSPDGGLDLRGVVVGAEGCFGLVTEVEVELLPLPEGVRTLLAVFDEIEDAGRAVTAVIGRGLLPAALEIVDRETIRAVEASVYAAGYPVGAGAALVVEFDGIDAGLEEDLAQVEACCQEAGAREVRRARDEAERAALWKGRKKAFGAMGRVAPDLLVQDATVPRTRLPEVLGRIGEIARRFDLTVANVFHAGDGNLHPNILFDRRDAAELERVEQASKEMMAVCVEAGGTITGEHGVGVDKRRYMHLVHGPAELAAMADVKSVFDPGGSFNPGKVLPDGVPSATPSLASPRSGGRPEGSSPAPSPARSPERVFARLEGLLGNGAVDRGSASGPVVVFPASVGEVAAVLELAHASGWRVRPRGAGLERPRSAGAREVDVVLRTTSLQTISDYEPADLTLTAGAGVSLDALAERTGPAGQWLPIDPPGSGEATLGGVLAAGVGGSLAGAFGRPRDLVLGLTTVTGDGRILRLGGRVVKNVAGFDLVKLMVGSRGRLGVVTDATVRLFPVPAVDRVLVARAEEAGSLVDLVRSVAAAPFPPAALELAWGLEGREGAWAVVRLLGSEPAVEAQQRSLLERTAALEPVEAGEGRALLAALRSAGQATDLVVRLSFPPARLASVLELLAPLAAAATGEGGKPPTVVAHAARGVLRWSACPGVSAGAEGLGEPLSHLRQGLASLGGGVAVRGAPDGGPGGAFRGRDPVVRRLEEGLVARFDPGAVLTPGEGGPEPAVGAAGAPAGGGARGAVKTGEAR